MFALHIKTDIIIEIFIKMAILKMKKTGVIICTTILLLRSFSVAVAEDDLPAIGVTPPPPPSEFLQEETTEPAVEVTVKKETSLTDNIKDNAEAVEKRMIRFLMSRLSEIIWLIKQMVKIVVR